MLMLLKNTVSGMHLAIAAPQWFKNLSVISGQLLPLLSKPPLKLPKMTKLILLTARNGFGAKMI
jgi:hypothetical protein